MKKIGINPNIEDDKTSTNNVLKNKIGAFTLDNLK
jgi:hypothetical protein